MNSNSFLILSRKLELWYEKKFVVPLVLPVRVQNEPWDIAKRLLSDESNGFFLDSGRFQKKIARYSYLGWSPFRIFRTRKSPNPISELRTLFSQYRGRKWLELPFFTGGAIGYLSYELARAFEQLPDHARDDLDLDRMVFLFVRDLVVFDEQKRIYFLIANLIPKIDGPFEKAFERAVRAIKEMKIKIMKRGTIPDHGDSPHFLGLAGRKRSDRQGSIFFRAKSRSASGRVLGNGKRTNGNSHFQIHGFQSDVSKREFKHMVRRAKEYIEAGDIYQVNLSQRFSFEFKGQPETLYESLRQINPSPFSSFLKIGPLTVAGVSPERLIKLDGNMCETRPIAGTRPRGATRREERRLRRDLMMSAKERAEHIMLVDLERNDLGRVSEPHSVRVNGSSEPVLR